MSKEDILGQISGEDWIKKGGLDVPDDIFSALESPFDWFDSLKPISFSRGNLPTIENILSYFSESEIGNLVKSSSLEMLRTSYGINKCFNSKVYSNLTAKGDQIAANLKLKNRDRQIYQAAIKASNLFLNIGLVKEQLSSIDYNGQIGDSIYEIVKNGEVKNKDWLTENLESAQNSLENAAKDIISKIKRLIKKLKKVFEAPRPYEFGTVQSSYTISSNFSPSAIVPVASPSVVDVIGVVNSIASGLLQTFILKGVAIPAQLAEAVTKTVTSLVLKGLNASGVQAVRYIAGGVLRDAKDLLPAVFNNTGMFAGAWSFLTSCAPYIIAAAVIIIITIKLSQKTDIGNWITLLAVGSNKNQEPDTVFARVIGDVQEKLKDLDKIKEDLIEETGKQYANVYAFSFDGDAKKLCIDMSLAVPIPMKDEIATTLWTEFSTKFDFLIQE